MQHFEGYDSEGFSFWFCDYKYDEENTVNFIVMNKVHRPARRQARQAAPSMGLDQDFTDAELPLPRSHPPGLDSQRSLSSQALSAVQLHLPFAHKLSTSSAQTTWQAEQDHSLQTTVCSISDRAPCAWQVGGFLQRLDYVRKYAFGVICILKNEQGQFPIRWSPALSCLQLTAELSDIRASET